MRTVAKAARGFMAGWCHARRRLRFERYPIKARSMVDRRDTRRLSGAALAQALRDSRSRTWSLVDDLSDAQWQVSEQPGVNPIAWELGHLAWFAEFWVLRGPHTLAADGFTAAHRPPRHAGLDARFDSARIAHAQRWRTPLPSRAELRDMLGAQLDACLAAMPAGADDAALYFHRLALFHEDMHGEAFTWLRAALGLAAPLGFGGPRPHLNPLPEGEGGRVRVPGGSVQIGWPSDEAGFAFDNEQPARTLTLADFEIDAAPLTVGAFLRFVEAGGYDTPAFWPGAAGVWRAASGHRHPQRWRRDPADGSQARWQTRWFDRWQPLAPDAPLIHVNAFEAEAYCRWAKRRLPTAAEWEHAAPLHWGASVWEWTADAFSAYPGFAPGPYREYSAPWFGDHRELRGGAFATSARLHDPRYRNFFEPHRTDVFAGFRTAAKR
jgi:gamma-glutamyl hercynylcysteine S-oxide synthase